MPKPGYKNKVNKPAPPQEKKKKKKKQKKAKVLPKNQPRNKKLYKISPEFREANEKQDPIQKKSFPDYKGLNEREFYEAVAQWADMYDKARMERYTKAMAEVIIHELVYAGEVRVPYVGTFAVQRYKGYEYKAKGQDGKMHTVTVPARQLPVFVPCDSLINDINEIHRTHEYKRRKNRGEFTWRDYVRALRMDLYDAEDENFEQHTEETEAKVKKLHEKFRQSLGCHDVRSLEKIIDISEERADQLERKKERQERLKQRDAEDE